MVKTWQPSLIILFHPELRHIVALPNCPLRDLLYGTTKGLRIWQILHTAIQFGLFSRDCHANILRTNVPVFLKKSTDAVGNINVSAFAVGRIVVVGDATVAMQILEDPPTTKADQFYKSQTKISLGPNMKQYMCRWCCLEGYPPS